MTVAAPVKEAPADFAYPTGIQLALIMTAMFLGMFLVALVCSSNNCMHIFLRGHR